MKQIVLINRDETSRMKLKRCKIQDVAYQDEKLRMQQIGAPQGVHIHDGIVYIIKGTYYTFHDAI